uniref:ZP domain-containing protein n=1 Tax=Haemonchus placei TaxID=6290 RepID=A0A0N4X5T6_HAEPC
LVPDIGTRSVRSFHNCSIETVPYEPPDAAVRCQRTVCLPPLSQKME